VYRDSINTVQVLPFCFRC